MIWKIMDKIGYGIKATLIAWFWIVIFLAIFIPNALSWYSVNW